MTPYPPPPAATPSGSRALRLALVALFVGVVAAFFALGGQRYLSLDAIKANRDALLAFTQAHFAASLAIAFVVYVAVTAFSRPGLLSMKTLTCSVISLLLARSKRRP